MPARNGRKSLRSITSMKRGPVSQLTTGGGGAKTRRPSFLKSLLQMGMPDEEKESVSSNQKPKSPRVKRGMKIKGKIENFDSDDDEAKAKRNEEGMH